MREPELSHTKNYYRGFAVWCYTGVIYRILLSYSDFFAPIEMEYALWKIGNIIFNSGAIFSIYNLETYVYKKTKHFFTIFLIILLTTFIIIPDVTLGRYVNTLGNVFAMIFLPLMLNLMLVVKTSGDMRRTFIFITMGLFLFVFGASTGIFQMLGIIDVTTAYVGGHLSTVIGILLWGYGLTSIFKGEKVKTTLPSISEIGTDESRISLVKNLIESRPGKISEEEVSVSKEKKICMICKGKVGKFMYMCTECEAFYCFKCASAVIEIENTCWVCNAPFDDSKPVKPYKKQDEAVDLEDLDKKDVLKKR